MMKIVASSGGGPGKSYFRAMTANENMDRRSAEAPQQVPVNNYFDFDGGIMQACVRATSTTRSSCRSRSTAMPPS